MWDAQDDAPQLSCAASRHNGLNVFAYTKVRMFSTYCTTMQQNFLYVDVFYKDRSFYEKSTFILHFYRNISGLVYNLNIRQYVSSIALKRMRSQALS